jgi:nucleoside-diphosphate-sugar epimerase
MGPCIYTGYFTSGKICAGILERHFNKLPPMSIVDIRDVSQAHLAAAQRPAAANQRFILSHSTNWFYDLAKPLHDEFNDQGWIFDVGQKTENPDWVLCDNSKSKEILGIEYKIPIMNTMVEMAYSLIE